MGCGVFGAISSNENVVPYIYWGLRSQNHRGQQSYGFATYENGGIKTRRGLGPVPKWPNSKNHKRTWIDKLESDTGIGSVRYTTFGKTDPKSLKKGAQPVIIGELAEVFNGGIVETKDLKDKIIKKYPRFDCPNCDLEYIARRQSIETKDTAESVRDIMKDVEGAYSVAAINKDGDFFAFRDPHGIRPLCFGFDESRGLHAVASETVGLNINRIPYEPKNFEVRPGEMIMFRKDGIEREQIVSPEANALCSFEFAYFARPDSRITEKTDKFVYEIREEFGRNLAQENPEIFRDADMMISIPDTSDDATFGAHEVSGLKWERCSRRHRYVTERAFQLLKSERQSTVEKKVNIIPEKVKGKKVLVIEDSMVRCDSIMKNAEKLRRDGAKKIYVLLTYPKIKSTCMYGVDMATHEELIGADKDEEEIAKFAGVDTVRFQSLNDYKRATGMGDNLCFGCITGKYPTHCAQKIIDEKREAFELASSHK